MQKKLLFVIPAMLLLAHCGKKSDDHQASRQKDYTIFEGSSRPEGRALAANQSTPLPIDAKRLDPELDFEVTNKTGRTIYTTCFTYIQKEASVRWRWDKSPIYKLDPDQSSFINIDTIPDESNRESVFGYLAIFDNEQEAHESIYELLEDRKKIDLDQIYKLHHKSVVVAIEKYGFKEAKLDFDIVDRFKKKRRISELDFTIENRTGKTIFTTGFIYQVKDNIRSVWSYDKTPVLRLVPGQMALVNIDTITNDRDRRYMSGYLAVFEEHQEKMAHDATYELLKPKNRISIGRLSRLKGKKVIIDIEKYGAIGQVTEFDLQEATSPFAKRAITSIAPEQPIRIEAKAEPVKVKPKPVRPAPQNNKKYQFFE